MTVYKLFDDSSRFSSFSLNLEEFLDILDPHIGEQSAMQFSQSDQALRDFWTPLDISLRRNEGSENAAPDLTLWRGASLIMSKKAVDVFRPELASLGEFLPLRFDGMEYALFNCRKEVEADRDASVRVEEQGFFMDVEALAFPTGTDTLLFKCPFENNRNLFCTDEFRSLLIDHKLGGVYLGDRLADFM